MKTDSHKPSVAVTTEGDTIFLHNGMFALGKSELACDVSDVMVTALSPFSFMGALSFYNGVYPAYFIYARGLIEFDFIASIKAQEAKAFELLLASEGVSVVPLPVGLNRLWGILARLAGVLIAYLMVSLVVSENDLTGKVARFISVAAPTTIVLGGWERAFIWRWGYLWSYLFFHVMCHITFGIGFVLYRPQDFSGPEIIAVARIPVLFLFLIVTRWTCPQLVVAGDD